MTRIAALKDSVLVVAHPDDEVLWFSSLLDGIGKVIVVFQDSVEDSGLGERRVRAIAEMPFDIECLSFAEAGSFGQADWDHPRVTPCGLVLEGAVGLRLARA